MSFFGQIGEWFKDIFEHENYYLVTVKRGDSLWKLAEELTGDGMNWKKIADANPEKNWDQDYVIQPGEVLKIPKD